MAIPARIPMMAMTIISSIRVKPSSFLLLRLVRMQIIVSGSIPLSDRNSHIENKKSGKRTNRVSSRTMTCISHAVN